MQNPPTMAMGGILNIGQPLQSAGNTLEGYQYSGKLISLVCENIGDHISAGLSTMEVIGGFPLIPQDIYYKYHSILYLKFDNK